MATPSTLNAVIARVAAGLYDMQLGYATMDWAVKAVSSVTYNGSVAALVQSLYATDFKTHDAAAAALSKNLGLTGTVGTQVTDYVKSLLDTAGAGHEGETIVAILNGVPGLTSHPVAEIAAAAKSFNAQITSALTYSAVEGTPDVPVHPPVTQTTFFTITPETAAGADVMHLTGNQDVRIDFTNRDHQIRGLDLNGDGTIKADGQENNPAYLEANVDTVANNHAGFEIVDAYSRNPLNHTDVANNFLGDIAFDGTGYKGDGVSTNGNIFLGGLGHDTASTGDGNDFLAGGGIAQGHGGTDTMRGGRNADFFFAEFSGIDATDGGPSLFIDGGNTSDSTSGGDHGPQDSDWLLFEASDDDEPVQISLNERALSQQTPTNHDVQSRSGEWMEIDDVENVDASGNLYGFLDNVDVELGGRSYDDRDASNATVGYNYGLGSTAQLNISGSGVANIIIGGYDNDKISGGAGNDILFGGNLKFLNNPNSFGIVNDGRDELRGGSGDDNIVFEADGGVIDGGLGIDTNENGTLDGGDTVGNDTLWLTNYALGTQTATDLTKDGVLRFDLKASSLSTAAGYGGADVDGTQDQTNYKGATRVTMTGMESVISTGLGAIDYLASGANKPELLFSNQQNQLGYKGALDLRGTDDANTLYASDGADIIEGRGGNDKLSGGNGNDDFYFGTADGGSNIGDGVDVIHRQTDANGDNLWDTNASGSNLYEQDFNIGGTSTTGSSVLKIAIQKAGGNTAGTQLNQVVNNVSEIVTGVKDGASFVAIDMATPAIKAATTYQGLTDAINAALDATPYGADLQATLQADGFTIFIADAKGRQLADSSTQVAGAGVSVNQIANTATQNTFEYGAPAVAVTKDRLIYKAYEDRADNEGVDDDSYLGSTISLGIDSYAEDLVINFADEDGNGKATTRLAEDQSYTIKFTNLTTQDKVTIEVNGVKYSLQVGVDLDGNIIAAEDGVGDTQAGIQSAFMNRLNDFINSFMDDDTSAGKVASTTNGADTLTLKQAIYNGEQTVFMVKPTVTLQNLSGGEPASYTVTNVSQHEVELLDFDGRNGELNSTNVLFWGQEQVNRATLQTAKNAGDTITGSEAIVIDVGPNNLQDVVFGTTTAIPNNTATNDPLKAIPNGWAVHGDDFLIGGNGLDTISGGTGDDRIEGSIGGNGTTTWDVLDGGKNFYAVQVLGEAQARVYILNKWEAANPTKVAALTGIGVVTSITLIDQNETGTGVSNGVFDDTLQFSQKLFTPGVTRFTITLNDFTLNGGVVELRNDGAGTVGVDVDGNGTIDNWTKFTNFENVRTVSGTSNAVAGDGQGNDTLNVSAMSSATTGANGILYNLTNDDIVLGGDAGATMTPGEVRVSTNAHEDLTRPALSHFDDTQSLVIKVDGVENVIGGTGDDLLVIDETEAAKNNTFTGDLGDDRIEYRNNYNAPVEALAEPTLTIKLDGTAASVGGTDTVTSTAGRVGSTVATDTLNGVEFITLSNFTAAGSREDDVLDVTSIAGGAVVSYVDGTVKDLAGVQHLKIEGIAQIENVWADGNDTVIVADADTMNDNLREDTADATASKDLSLATFLDFDQLNATNARVPFIGQTSAQIENAVNQGEFKFNLSKTGSGADTDTVDYSNAVDNIAVVVELDATKPNQYVMVDGDGATFYGDVGADLTQATDRVDVLTGVERIVAAQGESVLDLSASTKGLEIKWSAFDVANQTAALDRDSYSVRISDLSTASPLQRTFVEYRDAGLSATTTQPKATWSRVEGSDNAEVLILNSAHSTDANAFNLRGGANQVKYNELTKSITLNLAVTDWNAADPLNTGKITGTVTFQDGQGAGVESGTFLGGSHTITSYTANNGIAAGSLKIAASQDAEDTIKFAGGLGDKLLVLSEIGTVDNQITVKLGSGSAQNSVILTGFELLTDSATNDVYDFGSLINAIAGLDILDNADPTLGSTGDHDTIKVGNDAVGYDGANALGGGAQIAGATEISLGALRDVAWKATTPVRGFDFDVLDVTKVTDTTVTTLTGASVVGEFNTDEVVIGKINNITSAQQFESVVFTQATVAENGTTYVLNTTANTVTAGAKTITLSDNAATGNYLSFGGTVMEQAAAPNHLRAATDLNATTGVTVTVVGNESVNITGGNGNDSITSKGGNDTLRGGSGDDTLDGGFTAATAPVISYSLNGGAAVLAADGDRITILGRTVEADNNALLNVAGASVVVPGSDSDTVGAAFAAVSLANWKTAITGAGTTLTAGEIADLQSVTYDAAANRLIFTFTGNDSGVAQGDFTAATVTGGSITVTLGNAADVAYAAATQSADTYVFEATAALNGVDTINNFNNTNLGTDDKLDFRAFLGGASNIGGAANITAGLDLSGAANVGVVWNKGSLAAADIVTTATAGKIAVENNGKAVVLVTADADGAAGDGTIDAYKVYFIQDTDTGAGQTWAVTLVGTINSGTELNAADLVDGTSAFV